MKIEGKRIMPFLIFFLAVLQVFVSCKNQKANKIRLTKNNASAECCEKIMVNSGTIAYKRQLMILYTGGGDLTHLNKIALNYIESKNNRFLIAEYQIFPSKFKDSCIYYYDTLKQIEDIKKLAENIYRQPLFKLPCGTVYENDSKCCTDLIVYFSKNGIESCYVCAFTEIAKHSEFMHFANILEDTTYFKVPLSKINLKNYNVIDTIRKKLGYL